MFVLLGCKEKPCITYKQMKIDVPLNIAGVVTKKYDDPENRGLTSLIVSQDDTIIRYTMDIMLEHSFYLHVEVGDSVYKPSGTLRFTLVKNDSTRQKYNHKCF